MLTWKDKCWLEYKQQIPNTRKKQYFGIKSLILDVALGLN